MICFPSYFSHPHLAFQFSNPDMPGYVGFANLPNQIHSKSVKKGLRFTLMVVGELIHSRRAPWIDYKLIII